MKHGQIGLRISVIGIQQGPVPIKNYRGQLPGSSHRKRLSEFRAIERGSTLRRSGFERECELQKLIGREPGRHIVIAVKREIFKACRYAEPSRHVRRFRPTDLGTRRNDDIAISQGARNQNDIRFDRRTVPSALSGHRKYTPDELMSRVTSETGNSPREHQTHCEA